MGGNSQHVGTHLLKNIHLYLLFYVNPNILQVEFKIFPYDYKVK